jgi:hypothetical protein
MFGTASPTQTALADFGSLMSGQPCWFSAGSIQSPYIHRANGLLQIAVSKPFRLNVQANGILLTRSAVDTALVNPIAFCKFATSGTLSLTPSAGSRWGLSAAREARRAVWQRGQ